MVLFELLSSDLQGSWKSDCESFATCHSVGGYMEDSFGPSKDWWDARRPSGREVGLRDIAQDRGVVDG